MGDGGTGKGTGKSMRKLCRNHPSANHPLVSPQMPPNINPLKYPEDPAVLKILRIVNLLRVVNLLSHCDLLSWRTLCRHHFPGNYRHFSSRRRICGVVNMGGVVKTLRRSKFTILAIVVVFLVRKGPLGISGRFGAERNSRNQNSCQHPPHLPTKGAGTLGMLCHVARILDSWWWGSKCDPHDFQRTLPY